MTGERRSILHFIGMTALYGLTPVLLLIAIYALLDPFGAVRKNSDFGNGRWEYNRGMVSVRSYERLVKEGYRPNSFILGSSLAIYYPAGAWAEKLPPGAKVFHFDSSSQPLGTLRRSLEYLDRSGAQIDNALIILAADGLSWEPQGGIPYFDPAELHPDRPLAHLRFQYDFFAEFLDRGFLRGYIPYLFTGRAPEWSNKLPMNSLGYRTDPVTNEQDAAFVDSLIDREGLRYYAERGLCCAMSDTPHILPRQLTGQRKADLRAIRDLLVRHHTDYRVIIGPNRTTKILHPADEAIMRNIFGRRYFNFVIPMRRLGAQYTTYYDGFHYRPFVTRQIIDSVYRALPAKSHKN